MGHSCGVEKGKGFYERPFALHRPFQQNFVSAIHCTLIVLNAHQPINARNAKALNVLVLQ